MKNLHTTLLTSLVLVMLTGINSTITIAEPSPTTASVTTSKLVSQFTPLAGSTENSSALIQGLRKGTPIVLTNPEGTIPSTLTFTAPTRPMGYGNIRIALSLAQNQLTSQGITQPTAEQLQGALMGTSTTQQGILQLRASGMGWGQIANTMGVKLGSVMSGKTATITGTTNTTGGRSATLPTGVTTATSGKSNHSGITTAEGAKSSVGSKNITSGQGSSHAASASGGAVNATGSRAGGIGNAAGAGHVAGNKKP